MPSSLPGRWYVPAEEDPKGRIYQAVVVHAWMRIGIPSRSTCIFQRFARRPSLREVAPPRLGSRSSSNFIHGLHRLGRAGKGSRFTVSLPAQTPREAPALEETT